MQESLIENDTDDKYNAEENLAEKTKPREQFWDFKRY